MHILVKVLEQRLRAWSVDAIPIIQDLVINWHTVVAF